MATLPRPEWVAVDAYVERTLGGEDSALAAAREASREAGLPPIQVSAVQGKLLHVLARAVRARRVLEIGTLGGYSTLWLARAVAPEGHVTTLEINPGHVAVAQRNLRAAGVEPFVTIRPGPALQSLDAMVPDRDARFDFVFLDADKPAYPAYLERILRLVRPGALLVADNVVRGGAVADPASADPNVRGVRELQEAIGRSPHLVATTVQTVGAKGYDGVTIALVVEAEGIRHNR
ncbi:MAG: O-methyltransferase [Thermoplasmata archaeon]